MIQLAEKYFFLLMVYSIIGWVYETTLCSITAKRFINRGFLNGPYCPIYGCGAVLDIIILGRIEDPILLFVLGVLLTCSLEYITSLIMEKAFHARWWDYTDRKFNINGRVCLLGAIVFGTFSVLLIKFIHPFILTCIGRAPFLVYRYTTAFLFLLFVTDCSITISGFTSFNQKLKELTHALEQAKELVNDKINNTTDTVSLIYDRFLQLFNKQQWRMVLAFPRLKSIRYNNKLIELRKFMLRHKKNEANVKQRKKSLIRKKELQATDTKK